MQSKIKNHCGYPCPVSLQSDKKSNKKKFEFIQTYSHPNNLREKKSINVKFQQDAVANQA